MRGNRRRRFVVARRGMSLFGLIKRSKSEPSDRKFEPVMRELPAQPPPVPTPADVRQMLFRAIADGDDARLSNLCHEHRATIAEHLATWRVIPPALCANP